jgi:transposase InsO family protein
MEERIAMLRDYDSGAFSVSELSARYGVSRETLYFWRSRRASGEADWFQDRSHAPRSCPFRTEAGVVERIVAMRRRFAHFGPKKIRGRLLLDAPGEAWPAASTIGDILKREGLVEPVRRRRRPIEQGRPATEPLTVNSEWCVDFKGWFRTRDGQRVDPLTVTDNASRYLLGVQIVRPTHEEVKPRIERLFHEFGLPASLRSDNGAPFGSIGAGGLSRLSVWLLKLGVEPRFGRPSSPQDNGRHERMHRTLKAQTTRPASATAGEQQERFDAFRRHYNEERPHEALDQTPPAQAWRPSARPMPTRVDDPWYDADHEVRRVRPNGEIKWRGETVFIGEALAGEMVGVAERDAGQCLVRFCHHDLGLIAPNKIFRRFAPPRARRGETAETKQE